MSGPGEPGRLRFWSAGVGVDVVGLTPELDRLSRHAGAAMLDGSETSPEVTLRVSRTVHGSSTLDGVPLDADPLVATATVVAAVDRAMLSRTPAVCVHAAVVAGNDGAAVLPGASGAGKTTLAAACMQVGLALVSDESACIDPESLLVLPHPRPLGLSRHSRTLLAIPSTVSSDDEVAMSPTALGRVLPARARVPVALLVLLDRRTGSSATLGPVTRSQAMTSLMANQLDVGGSRRWSPEFRWSTLGRLAARAPVLRLTFDAPCDAAYLLAERLGGPPR